MKGGHVRASRSVSAGHTCRDGDQSMEPFNNSEDAAPLKAEAAQYFLSDDI